MKNNKELITTKGMLYKTIMFFRKLFGINKNVTDKTKKQDVILQQEKQKIENNDFRNRIIIRTVDDKKLIELQENFRKNIITEEEMNEDDRNELHKLYDRQIKKQINKIRQNIYIKNQYKKNK